MSCFSTHAIPNTHACIPDTHACNPDTHAGKHAHTHTYTQYTHTLTSNSILYRLEFKITQSIVKRTHTWYIVHRTHRVNSRSSLVKVYLKKKNGCNFHHFALLALRLRLSAGTHADLQYGEYDRYLYASPHSLHLEPSGASQWLAQNTLALWSFIGRLQPVCKHTMSLFDVLCTLHHTSSSAHAASQLATSH